MEDDEVVNDKEFPITVELRANLRQFTKSDGKTLTLHDNPELLSHTDPVQYMRMDHVERMINGLQKRNEDMKSLCSSRARIIEDVNDEADQHAAEAHIWAGALIRMQGNDLPLSKRTEIYEEACKERNELWKI